MYEYTSNLYKHGLSNNNKKLRLLTTVHVYVVQCPKNNLDLCKRPSMPADTTVYVRLLLTYWP